MSIKSQAWLWQMESFYSQGTHLQAFKNLPAFSSPRGLKANTHSDSYRSEDALWQNKYFEKLLSALFLLLERAFPKQRYHKHLAKTLFS